MRAKARVIFGGMPWFKDPVVLPEPVVPDGWKFFTANEVAFSTCDLVVVETDDALLVCPRDRAQDVGKIVKWLEAEKLSHLL